MLSLTGGEEDDDEHKCSHKDCGAKGMNQDQDDVQKLNDLSKTYNPFDCTSPKLVSVTTGDIASEAVTNGL